MKKILLFSILFVSLSMKAQLTNISNFTSSTGSNPEILHASVNQVINNKLIYPVFGTTDARLLTTDGTTAGTGILLKDLGVNYSHSYGNNVDYTYAKTDTKIYLLKLERNDDFTEFTYELWVTDGTAANTNKVYTSNFQTIISYSIYGYRQKLMPNFIGDKLIFIGKDPSSTQSIVFISDGTISGTQPLLSASGQKIYNNTVGTKMNGKYYFSGRTDVALGTNGSRVWVTDGTQAGTQVVNSTQTDPTFITDVIMSNPVNNKFYFWAGNSVTGFELWQSDGTDAGTTLFYETLTGSGTLKSGYGSGMGIFAHNNNLYFLLQPTNGVNTFDLYCAKNGDGSQIQKIYTTVNHNPTDTYAAADGRLYFLEQPFASGNPFKLTCTDGTIAGTVTLGNVSPGSPREFALYNNSIYFANSNPTPPNQELWRSDFTGVNFGEIFDIWTGCPTASVCFSSSPKNFFHLNNELYFTASSGPGVTSLFKFNGDFTFNGSANNDWNNRNNWNSNIVPNSADNVTIPSGFNITTAANTYAKNISIASPISMNTGNMNIYGNATISNSAKITLNANNFVLKGNSSSASGNTTSYIVTNGTGKVSVENLNTTRATLSLPIGTATNFNPITLANTGTSDTFSVRVESGLAQNYTGETQGTAMTTNGVNATWYITEGTTGGSNATVGLQWDTTQELSGFDRNSAYLGHYNGSLWEGFAGTLSVSNPYTYTASGITSFSPFSVLGQSALSTNSFDKERFFTVYPNPSNGTFTIQVSNDMLGAKGTVCNLVGQKVKEFELNSLEYKQNLNSGVYLITLEKDNVKEVKKIVVR